MITEKEWFELNEDTNSIEMIKKEYPRFNQKGLEEELIKFTLFYMKYLEEGIRLFKYVECDVNVENYIKQIKLKNEINCFNNPQFINVVIKKFISTKEVSTITAQIAVASENNRLVKLNNIGIPIRQKNIYQLDYTILKNRYKEYGIAGNIKKLNRKIITDFKIIK